MTLLVCIGAILTEILCSRNPQSDHVTCVLCPRLWIFRLLNCGKASCQLTPFCANWVKSEFLAL